MVAWIDKPADVVDDWSFWITGWVAGMEPDFPVTVKVNEKRVRHHRIERPDLRHALPNMTTAYGISARVSVLDVLAPGQASADPRISICVSAGGREVVRDVTIGSRLRDGLPEQVALRTVARDWVQARLRCPRCGAGDNSLVRREREVACTMCRSAFPQDGATAIDMRTERLRALIAAQATLNVSSNPYQNLAAQLVQRTAARGGWVLDCGAGSRECRMPGVINVDIADYFSTDVLAAGEALPFVDNAFDGALSLAVLEHVHDPFACARELLRVVRPGGEIVCSVPFLQPVHGYPSHYYNMTREGLSNLFIDGGDITQCFTPRHGHPIYTLQWFLTEYLHGLSPSLREKFGAMTLAEAAAIRFPNALELDYVRELSPDATRIIACVNTVVVRKRLS